MYKYILTTLVHAHCLGCARNDVDIFIDDLPIKLTIIIMMMMIIIMIILMMVMMTIMMMIIRSCLRHLDFSPSLVRLTRDLKGLRKAKEPSH